MMHEKTSLTFIGIGLFSVIALFFSFVIAGAISVHCGPGRPEDMAQIKAADKDLEFKRRALVKCLRRFEDELVLVRKGMSGFAIRIGLEARRIECQEHIRILRFTFERLPKDDGQRPWIKALLYKAQRRIENAGRVMHMARNKDGGSK